jgi:hypothetical protein
MADKRQLIKPGTLIGYCTICGRDCFNGVRHVCPKPMPRVRDFITLKQQVQRIVDHYDMRADLYTNDADLAGGMADMARAALTAAERTDR